MFYLKDNSDREQDRNDVEMLRKIKRIAAEDEK